jgi:hypothetical protein
MHETSNVKDIMDVCVQKQSIRTQDSRSNKIQSGKGCVLTVWSEEPEPLTSVSVFVLTRSNRTLLTNSFSSVQE